MSEDRLEQEKPKQLNIRVPPALDKALENQSKKLGVTKKSLVISYLVYALRQDQR